MFFAESLFPGAVGLEYTHGDFMKIELLYFGPNDEFEEPTGRWPSIGSMASAKVNGDYIETKKKQQSNFL